MTNTISNKLKLDEKAVLELEALVNKYGKDRNSLKPILHDLEDKYHRITDDQIQVLSDLMNISPIKIQEVITFYSFYNTEAKGKYIIRMCKTMPCKMAGAKEVALELERKIGIKFGQTSSDQKFTLEWTNCIGMCDLAPAFLINDKPYAKVTVDKIDKILKECE